MEKMLERAVLFAYRRAMALGADEIEAFETALDIVFDARPDIEDDAGRSLVTTIIRAASDAEQPPVKLAPRIQSRNCATIDRSSRNRRISRSRVA